MAPARLDSKALLAQKPERSALHRRRCGTAFERRHWSSGRLANRGGARIGQSSGRTSRRIKELVARTVTRAANSF
jgi:hypothetical protein